MSITSKLAGLLNKPMINYTQTTTLPFGTQVTTQQQMSTNEYFKETSQTLSGKEDKTSIFLTSPAKRLLDKNSQKEFDQASINNAMWAEADANQDGYVDQEEYQSLCYSAVTGKSAEGIPKGIAVLALGIGAALVNAFSGQLSMDEANSMYALYDADKDLDANGDGKYSRDEFENAAVNYILTGGKPQQEQET